MSRIPIEPRRTEDVPRRLARLVVGIVALGFGIAAIVRARLGVAPYDVLHQGISKQTGLSLGLVVILLGFVILLAWIPLHLRPGPGTVLNMLGVGACVDAALLIIPRTNALELRVPLLVSGIVTTALGIGLYLGAGLGPGPRDGLMTGIAARGFAIWAVRTVLELVSLVAGWTLGGDVGIGTVLFALSIGPLTQWFMQRLHFRRARIDLGPGLAGE